MSSSTAIEPTNGNGNAVATQPTTIKQWLNNDAFKAELARALPRHCNADRMARIAITCMTRVPKLAECEPASFMKCLLDLSQWGLEPNGRDAHLIPFNNNKRGVVECQLILDYKGLVQLLYRSGQVLSIHADVVFEGDDFEFSMGQVIRHTPWWLLPVANRPVKQGEMVAAYARVELKGNAVKCEVMSKDQIDGIRKRSKAANSGPWVTDYNEMAKKGLALDTPIPTPVGWSTMGDLQVGDTVFDMDGDPVKVLAVSDVKQIDCFRVDFADGESITCDDEHRWVARIDGVGRPEWPVHTINELYDAKRAGLPVSMPVASALNLPDIDLPIDPWVLGFWLGDGNSRGASITCSQVDFGHVSDSVGGTSLLVGKTRIDTRSNAMTVGIKRGLKDQLRSAGLLGNKHIPDEYLRASFHQRLRLLQGLMDSDGHIASDRGRAIFEQTNKRIADSVCELLASMGEKFFVNEYDRKGFGTTAHTYRIEWQPVHCPATMPRKVARFRERANALYRGVARIERVASVPTKCIAVDSPTSTYLAGRSMIPTHNTAFRRTTKWLPVSAEIIEAIERDDDRPAHFGASHVIDGDFVVPPSSLKELADQRKAKQGEGADEPMADDGEIPNDGPPTLDSVFSQIDAATSAIEVDDVRRRYVGPEATEGGFEAAEWTEIDRFCNERIAKLSKPAKGQKELLDKGSEAPE